MTVARNKAVFLDRDGVLNNAIIKNNKPYPPQNLQALEIPPDVLPSLLTLKSAGFLLIGATNQPDVARGKILKETVKEINAKILLELPLDDLCVCYHDDKDQCPCRKPKPGLLLEAAHNYHIDLSQSYMIGDRWKDVEAGKSAGCKTVWLYQAYDEPQPSKGADYMTTSLSEGVSWIIRNLYEITRPVESKNFC